MSDQPDAERVETERALNSDSLAPLSATERRDLVGLGVLAGCWALLPALFGFWLLAEIGWVSERYE